MATVKKKKLPVKKTAPRTRKKKSDGAPIVLPTGPNVPSTDLRDYMLLLYGEKGVGKTSLVAQFPDSLVFMFEPWRRNLRIMQVPKDAKEPPLNEERFEAYVDTVCQSKSVKTIGIDTIDRAYICFIEAECARQGIGWPSDVNNYGATWNRIKRRYELAMDRLRASGKQLIPVSHAKYWAVPTKTGEEDNEQVIPTCMDSAWQYLKAVADFAIYYGYVGRERAITIEGGDLVWSDCGVDDVFMDAKTGRRITTFLAGGTAKDAYKALNDAFHNRLVGIDTPSTATPGKAVKKKGK